MSQLFYGGVPTEPDVERLMTTLAIERGMSVTYEEVESIIKTSPKDSRFRTVTNAWRKRIFKNLGIQSKAEGGAFHFLTEEGALQKNRDGFSRAGRAVGRVVVGVNAIDTRQLSQEKQELHRLVEREARAMLEAIQRSAKVISAPSPVSGQVRQLRQ